MSGTGIVTLDTVANGDWILVGYTSVFDAIDFYMTGVNSNAATMTVEVWTGAAWETLGLSYDGTTAPSLASPSVRGTATFSRSGRVYLSRSAMSGTWTSTTINGFTGFFARISVSAALTNIFFSEIRVLKVPANTVYSAASTDAGWLYRGRRARADDFTDRKVIWEPYGYITNCFWPSGMLATDGVLWPFQTNGSLFVGGLIGWYSYPFTAGNPITVGYELAFATTSSRCFAESPHYDFGTPSTPKTLERVAVRMRGANAAVTLHFFADNSATELTSFSTSGGVADAYATSYSTLMLSAANAFSGAAFRRLRIAYDLLTETWNDFPLAIESVELVAQEMLAYKKEIQMLLHVGDGLVDEYGSPLPDAITQLTALEALRGTRITLLDPIGRSLVVMVYAVQEMEAYSHGLDMAGMAVRVQCEEE